MQTPVRTLTLLCEDFAIARLAAADAIPEWAMQASSFVCICRTPTELSIVSHEAFVPIDVQRERKLRCLRVEGPLPLDLIGVMASVAVPLAEASVPLFPIATYDHDYIFVPERHLAAAISSLRDAGHSVLIEKSSEG